MLEYGRISRCLGLVPFVVVGFPHCHAVTEITLSSVIIFLSLSFFLLESLLHLLDVFCSSKICLYFLRNKAFILFMLLSFFTGIS